MKSSRNILLRLIAVFKFFKAALLIALGIGAFRFLHRDLAHSLKEWIGAFRLDPANHYLEIALSKAGEVNPAQIKKLGLGSFIYAALFLTEGAGLWLGKRWAEWLTVIITGSLIPFEVYEIFRRFGWLKVGGLALNVVIVAYLIYHVRSRKE